MRRVGRGDVSGSVCSFLLLVVLVFMLVLVLLVFGLRIGRQSDWIWS